MGQCIAVQYCTLPHFSLCLSATYHYIWALVHSEQRVFMSLQCINLNF